MPSFKEQLKFAYNALCLSKSLNTQTKSSYLKALRVSATEALGLNIGRAIPIKNEGELKRVIFHAERNNRPFAVATSEDKNKTYILLVDTEKTSTDTLPRL